MNVYQGTDSLHTREHRKGKDFILWAVKFDQWTVGILSRRWKVTGQKNLKGVRMKLIN